MTTSTERQEEIVEDLRIGFNITEICQKYKMGRATVRKIRDRFGISPKLLSKKLEGPFTVSKFCCPVCRRFSTLIAEWDDKICFVCSLRMMRKK